MKKTAVSFFEGVTRVTPVTGVFKHYIAYNTYIIL